MGIKGERDSEDVVVVVVRSSEHGRQSQAIIVHYVTCLEIQISSRDKAMERARTSRSETIPNEDRD